MTKIRNIVIFVIIATIFVLIYIYFIKSPSSEQSLVSSAPNTALPNFNDTQTNVNVSLETSVMANDFLALLLSVKNIKLDDAIFFDPSFSSLRDTSITLVPDGTEGRPNPFAQFGNDAITAADASNFLDTNPETPQP